VAEIQYLTEHRWLDWKMSHWPNYSVEFNIYINNKSLTKIDLPFNINLSLLMALAADHIDNFIIIIIIIPLFHVSSSYKNCLSARCATVANSSCNQLDVFRRQIVTLSEMWYCCAALLQGVLINYLSNFYLFVCVCFICVLFIVRCYLCLYVVLFV
jgi:hypothetical protein